ncbi:ARM repeat-containing protein [Cystobasidium minutum MCA 4210]|uniref:ARM repeat-containing protein n=1 Tax=Cystobasidium minutum MCA 4210 TaxID=1397322 RepID=UPI0034CDA2C1|eukprot:jgi/Rhomi1/56422/CE56421_1304
MDAIKLPAGLLDKTYDRRKTAALEVERMVRECLLHDDKARIKAILQQLVTLASTPGNPAASRNGGIMGLAGASISLGHQNIAPYINMIVPAIINAFSDPDQRIRYYACEAMYNVTKVGKGEMLLYFNELFDAMSKLAADVDQTVKNGGELLDRQIKDIVVEQASTYVSARPASPSEGDEDFEDGPSVATEGRLTQALQAHEQQMHYPPGQRRRKKKAFSLERFIPLLAERIYVINPFTRTYLVTWLTVLDSVPELELISYLPHFLDGLLKFLQDPTEDIRNATMHVLADFLKEIQEAAEVNRVKSEARAARREKRLARQEASRSRSKSSRRKSIEPGDMSLTTEIDKASISEVKASSRRQSPRRGSDAQNKVTAGPSTSPAARERESRGLSDIAEGNGKSRASSPEGEDDYHTSQAGSGVVSEEEDLSDDEAEGEGTGSWVPGQGVKIDYAAIVEILLRHLERGDEEIQATCLRWINEFLVFAKDTTITFTPRLIRLVLPSLAHHFPAISHIAKQTNYHLFRVVQQLPAPQQPVLASREPEPAPPATSASNHNRRESATTIPKPHHAASVSPAPVPFPSSTTTLTSSASSTKQAIERAANLDEMINEMNHSGNLGYGSPESLQGKFSDNEVDPFDYQLTVGVLLECLLDDSEETRIAAFQWLSMLHQKAPRKILSMHETFPVLLKMLSDPAEDVIKANLQLLAQISSSSEEDSYFPVFMSNLLQIFSTDRKLLETRGSLIIRQLCSSLNTERIYRTFADLLVKDEDLEFASIMVQNLHTIMITSPELSDFRKRLKNLETKDGQNLFSDLYRSWCHNAVAAFSLCLLAQAYEHAANLLQIFADLEVSVSLLIQLDKLVQLLESPVFTSLRLQLLEPEKNPYLFKCLYGLLMFLPQSSAFVTLRNRLNAVTPLGFMHVAPKSASASSSASSSIPGRSTIRRSDDIRWQELLSHFRQVQMKHERARRSHMNDSDGQSTASASLTVTVRPSNNASVRRKADQGPPSVTSRAPSGKAGSTTSKASPLGGRPLSPPLSGAGANRAQKRLPSMGRNRVA